MKAAVIALGLLACCLSSAVALQQICAKDGVPLKPHNSLLSSNAYNAATKMADAKITWRNQLVTNPNGGCITGYTVEWFDASGAKKGQQFVGANSADEKTTTVVALPPGQKLTLKVTSVNSNTKKASVPETVGTITSAQGATQKPNPL